MSRHILLSRHIGAQTKHQTKKTISITSICTQMCPDQNVAVMRQSRLRRLQFTRDEKQCFNVLQRSARMRRALDASPYTSPYNTRQSPDDFRMPRIEVNRHSSMLSNRPYSSLLSHPNALRARNRLHRLQHIYYRQIP
jgi:hypothetical protein